MNQLILLLIPFFCLYPQITGTVIDAETSKPLQGVNIISREIGTASNNEGRFKLNVQPEVEVTFSHIGYESVILKLNLADITVRMKSLLIRGEHVIVTSTRAVIGDTPITASNISKKELSRQNTMKDFPALLSQLPSISTYSEGGLGLGYSYLFIRGFDQRKISVLIDGIPQNDPEDHNVYWVNFYDIQGFLEDIQVQRGAGSVHYGPPSIGGSINLITRQRNINPYYKINFGHGSYNTFKGSLEFNTGTYWDYFNTFLKISYSETDGYRNWSWANFKRYFFSTTYHSENHNIVLHIFGGPQEDGLTYNGILKEYQNDPELRKVNPSEGKGVEWFNQPHYDLKHEWNISDNFNLNSTFLYLEGEGYFNFDGSWASMEYLRLDQDHLESQYSFNEIQQGFELSDVWYAYVQKPEVAEKSIIRANVNKRQFGIIQSLDYSDNNSTFEFGYEYRKAFSHYWNKLQKSAEVLASISGDNGRKYVEFDSGKDMISIFTKTSYKLNESINLSSAIQIALNSYRIENEKYRENEFEYSYNAFVNPRLGINWNMSPTTFFYSQLSVTNREPQITSLYDAADAVGLGYWGDIQPQFDTTTSGEFDFLSPLIKPENVTDFEIGFGILNKNIKIMANLYYMKFNNELFVSELLYGYAPKYDNIDESLHYGMEVNTAMKLNQYLKINSNFSLNESEILVYNDSSAFEGNKIAGFPGVIYNGGIEYRFKNFTFNGTVKYIGKQFTSNDNTEELSIDPYSNLNIGIFYDAKDIFSGLQFNFHINNVLNDLYATYGTGSLFFMNVPRHYYMNISYQF